MSSTQNFPSRSPSVEIISREEYYSLATNPRVEPTFALVSSTFARRIQSPINEIEKVELVRLLRLGSLTVPTITHCDPSSPLLSLYLAFRDISWFMHVNNGGPPINYSVGVNLTRDHILSSLHQLGALPFLTALSVLPQRYANHHHTQQLFCTNCYHMGHRFLFCEHCKCDYCKVWHPKHSNSSGPLRRVHQRRKTSPSAMNAFKPSGTPITMTEFRGSPKPSSPSSNSPRRSPAASTSSSSNHKIKVPLTGKPRIMQVNKQRRKSNAPSTSRRPDTPHPTLTNLDRTDDLDTEPYEFDDTAMSNMCNEPVGGDDY